MKYLVYLLIALTFSTLSFAQYTPLLADDLNDTNPSSAGSIVHSTDSLLFISCLYNGNPEELIALNTYDSSIVRLGVLYSSARNTRTATFFTINSKLFFFAGKELWQTNGTPEGTALITTIDNTVSNLTVHNNLAYFTANVTSYGVELMTTDGTASGTSLLKDIYTGTTSSSPANLTIHNSMVYFTAKTLDEGIELWKTNGTTNGTVLVKDFYTGTSNSYPQNLISYNGELYFSQSTAAGTKARRTNGNDTTVITLLDTANQEFTIFSSPVINDGILFFAGGNATSGSELCRTLGTPTSTYVIKNMSYQTSSSNPTNLVSVRNLVFFIANVDNGLELYVSDGTSSGTYLTRDLYTIQTDAQIRNMTVVDSVLYFAAHQTDEYFNIEPYAVTNKYPSRLKDIYPGNTSSNSSSFTGHRGKLFFMANDGEIGSELWTSNGTSSGTTIFKDLNISTPSNIGLTSIAAMPNGVIFNAGSKEITQNELWSYQAGDDTAMLILDYGGSSKTGNPINLLKTQNGIYFSVYEPTFDMEINYYDFQTKSISKILDNGKKNYVNSFTFNNDKLYYTLKQTLNPDIWVYNEKTKSTSILTAGIQPNGFGATASQLTSVGNLVYFTADNYTEGVELYATDGTTSGTKLMKDIYSGFSDAYPSSLCNFKDSVLIFRASNPTYGAELYISDGTSTGTKLLKDIVSGSTSSSPSGMTSAASYIIFSANNGTNGNEPWITDGTASGTALLKDLDSGSGSSNPQYFTYVKDLGLTFFVTTNAEAIKSLWVTDGTEAGTVFLKEFMDSSFTSSYSMNFKSIDEALFFTARTDENGIELWTSDGTASGTKIVKDIAGGPASSTPENLTLSDGYLYFSANDGVVGKELWYMQVSCLSARLSTQTEYCKNDSFTPTVELVRFNDATQLSYMWSVNDSVVSTSSMYKTMLDSIAPSTVKLEVSSAKGCKDEQEIVINTYDIPVVDFEIEKDSLCLGSTYKYTNTSAVGEPASLTYLWSLGDNTTATSQSSSRTYSTSGNKTITLSIKNYTKCEASKSKNIFVAPVPGQPFILGPVTSLKTEEKYYLGSAKLPNSSFQWTVTNATILSGQGTDTIYVKWTNRPGTSNITCTENSEFGCLGATTSKKITIDKTNSIYHLTDDELVLYPNPNTGKFTLKVNQDNRYESLLIMNIQGQVIYTKKDFLPNQMIEAILPNGIYTVVLEGTEYKTTRRMVVVK